MPNLIGSLGDIKCNSPRFSTCIQRVVNTLTQSSQVASSGPESMKPILKVREKVSDVKLSLIRTSARECAEFDACAY